MTRILFPALLLAAPTTLVRAQDVMYALNSSATSPLLMIIDQQSGTVLSSVPVTGHEALFGGLAIDAAGDFYSIDGYNDPNSDRTFRIDPVSGVGTVVGDTGFNWNFRCVAVHPLTDVLYGWTDNELYTIDRQTGAATLLHFVTGTNLDQATALAIGFDGKGYLTDIGDRSLFELDLATGQTTFLGHLFSGGGAWFSDLDFDSSGTLWGAYSAGGLYTIDIASVTATFVLPAVNYRGLAFQRDMDPGTKYCTPAIPNSTGVPASIAASGSPAVSANFLNLTVEDLPAGQFAYFLTSQTQGNFNPPGSSGFLCLGGSIGRYNQPANVGVGPSFGIAVDLTWMPVNPPVAVVPGDTWNFQCWYRDVGNTSNFTDALSVSFF